MSNRIEWNGCKCEVRRGQFDINRIPLDCAATWRLISSGCTIGVFQLEKKLGQDWARRIKPGDINELADVLSLLRPGCLESGMTQDYVDIKNLKKKPSYPHPSLKPILESTRGCLVYQEQAIRIAVDLAGFSLAQADNLRKGIGKKQPEVIAKLKTEFADGAVNKGLVTRPVAEEIFGWIEAFQRYGFNKSHAVSYAMIAYQTAWLKCHFPMEFYTSYLTYSMYKGDEKEEVYRLVQDARLFGIEVLPPDVRECNPHFKMTEQGIRFGLAHVRGVGESAIQKITALQKTPEEQQEPVAESGGATRQAGAETLQTWPGFVRAATKLPRNVAEALAKAGACDCYGMPRTQMLAELEAILGTTVRDANGEKVEIRGLTEKELDFFLGHFDQCGSTAKTLELMASQGPNEGSKSISQMSKSELYATLEKIIPDSELKAQLTSKPTRKDLEQTLRDRGWKPPRRAVANEHRRAAIAGKAQSLAKEFKDTNTINARAEKHFLGISLSCSPADDADSSDATGTCMDVARAPNDQQLSVCAIIDLVRHTKTKKGKAPGSPMCFLTISDSTYSLDSVVVFPDAYEALKDLCEENNIVLVCGKKREGSFLVEDMSLLL